MRVEVAGYDEVRRLDCAGATAFVALHAVIGGRAFGGIRIRRYPDDAAALDDALLLARAMSRKTVMAGLDAGGGKTVLMEPEGDREAAVLALGEFIESLGGRYCCGPDLGFTAEDDAALRRRTGHVACGMFGEVTARGVLTAMRAVVEPESVAVQGLGAVGMALARMLSEGGVRVVGCDVRPVGDPGFETVPPEAIYDVEADVFAPCATGAVLDEATIPRLGCRFVCGGANNQLAGEGDADRLRERGIVYVPDFLANAGAVIDGGSRAMGEGDLVEERIAGIADRVREIVDRAAAEGRSPHHIAIEEADRRITERRRDKTFGVR